MRSRRGSSEKTRAIAATTNELLCICVCIYVYLVCKGGKVRFYICRYGPLGALSNGKREARSFFFKVLLEGVVVGRIRRLFVLNGRS